MAPAHLLPTSLALVPVYWLQFAWPFALSADYSGVTLLGYGDGVPRHASNVGPVWLGGRTRTIAGRVCMDQIVLDCDDDPVVAGDVATLFGPGDDGTPTADDWAAAVGTINYEIVTRFGGSRIPRVYDGTAGVPAEVGDHPPCGAGPGPSPGRPGARDHTGHDQGRERTPKAGLA